jgi:hypothetical protein
MSKKGFKETPVTIQVGLTKRRWVLFYNFNNQKVLEGKVVSAQ